MITFDSVGVGSAATGTSTTWQHVIGTSATALIVGVTFSGGTPSSVTRTVKVGAKTLASVGVQVLSSTDWVELFAVLAPPIGAQSVVVTSSASIKMTAGSAAYRGVSSFGLASSVFTTAVVPAYSFSLPDVAKGNWQVGAFGHSANVTFVKPADFGVERYYRSATPSLALVDEVSTGSSVNIALSMTQLVLPLSRGAVLLTLNPVAGSTGIAQAFNSKLIVEATPTAGADSTSVRMAVASLSATVSAAASIQVVGQREFTFNTAITATPTASAWVAASAAAQLAATFTITGRPNPSLWTDNASLATTVTASATATAGPAPLPPTPAHSPLRYVGRYPDIESALAPRSYAITANDRTKVTTDFITKAVDNSVSVLATTAYVDQQDATKARKADVTAADEAYIPATGHGLAVLDSEGYVAASQIPSGIVVNRTAGCYVGTVGTGTVSGAGYRALLLGTVSISDPGFPYVVMPFGWVTGSDPSGTAKNRWSGTGNTAKVVVMPTTSDVVCGWGLCTASQNPSSYPITPAASMNVMSQKFNGAITLGLYGSVMAEVSGQSYTFGGGSFYVIVLPAV